MNIELSLAIQYFAALAGFAGLIISLVCVAMVAGFLRSTHSVQYVPHDNKEVFTPQPDVVAENEKALMDKVGKKKKDAPTVIEPLDATLEEVTRSDINF